jgi:hypothetical protein
VPIGVGETRIQLDRAPILADRFVEAKLRLESKRFGQVSRSVIWIERERFRRPCVDRSEVIRRVMTSAERWHRPEGRPCKGQDILRIDGKRPFARSIGLAEDNCVSQYARLTFDSQILCIEN